MSGHDDTQLQRDLSTYDREIACWVFVSLCIAMPFAIAGFFVSLFLYFE